MGRWAMFPVASRGYDRPADDGEMMRRLLFISLILFCAGAFAQAPAGYTKIASTNGLSQIDTAVTAGQIFNYTVTTVVTAADGTVIESAPSNIITAVIPTVVDGLCGIGITHCVDLAWVASATTGVTYNVYRQLVTSPNPPGVLTKTVH
jgi:hypothetical protein